MQTTVALWLKQHMQITQQQLISNNSIVKAQNLNKSTINTAIYNICDNSWPSVH